MSRHHVVPKERGTSFGFLGDKLCIKVFAVETDGEYSVIQWTVAPGADSTVHAHNKYDETFYILDGRLTFVVDGVVSDVGKGDFVRIPAGTRHGYTNSSSEPADMLVTFSPGGMERVFFNHRTDAQGIAFNRPIYMAEAKAEHDTDYGDLVKDWLVANA